MSPDRVVGRLFTSLVFGLCLGHLMSEAAPTHSDAWVWTVLVFLLYFVRAFVYGGSE